MSKIVNISRHCLHIMSQVSKYRKHDFLMWRNAQNIFPRNFYHKYFYHGRKQIFQHILSQKKYSNIYVSQFFIFSRLYFPKNVQIFYISHILFFSNFCSRILFTFFVFHFSRWRNVQNKMSSKFLSKIFV